MSNNVGVDARFVFDPEGNDVNTRLNGHDTDIGDMTKITGDLVTNITNNSSSLASIASVYIVVGKPSGVDDTSLVQNAINSAPDGACLVFPYTPTTNYVCGQLNITKNLMFWAISPESVTLQLKAGSNVNFINMNAYKTLRIENITIDGNGSHQTLSPNYPNAVSCVNGTLKMKNCVVKNGTNYAIYAYGGTDIEILDCIVNQNSTFNDCIRIERTTGAKIKDCHAMNGLSGIRLQNFVSDVMVENCISEGMTGDVGITVASGTDIKVVNNTCRNNNRSGIEIDLVYRGIISGNICKGNGYHGILVADLTVPSSWGNGTMDGSTITAGSEYRGKDVKIVNNHCIHNTYHGVSINNMDKTEIFTNYLSDNNTSNGGYGGVGISNSNVTGGNNTFNNINNQTQSVYLNNRTYGEKLGKNFHLGGSPYGNYPVSGGYDANAVNAFCLNGTNLPSGDIGVIVADTGATKGLARQYTDSSTSGQVSCLMSIPILSKNVDQLAKAKVKLISGLPSGVSFIVALYNGTTWVQNVQTPVVTITNQYQEFYCLIPASTYSSVTYDHVAIQIQTGTTDTGTFNICECNLFYPGETV